MQNVLLRLYRPGYLPNRARRHHVLLAAPSRGGQAIFRRLCLGTMRGSAKGDRRIFRGWTARPIPGAQHMRSSKAMTVAYPCLVCGEGLVHLYGQLGYHCLTCEPHLTREGQRSETTMKCCGKQRIGNFCNECGRPLSNGLDALLSHCRANESVLRKRIERFNAKYPGEDFSERSKAYQRWKKWADELEELIKKYDDQRAYNALAKMWLWQKSAQELLPDGLAEEVLSVLGDKPGINADVRSPGS
jgi:hypothetical protein